MSKKQRNALLLVKNETTYNTDPTPTAALNAILCRNLDVQPLKIAVVDRATVRPYYGNSPQVVAAAWSTIAFEVELAGAGAAGTAPKWGPILRACGFSETISAGVNVTYAPISVSHESAAIYYYLDGLLHKASGARGNVSFDMSAQGIPVMKFVFTALCGPVTDTPMAAGYAFSGFSQPVAVNKANTTLTLHGYSSKMESFSLDAGNDVKYINRPGNEEVVIGDRNITGSVMMEKDSVAAKDWWSIVKAGTASTLALVHGTVAGNICTLSGPKVQLLDPTDSEKDGISMVSYPLSIQPNAGNDELSLVIT
jgi:hypothetical protein